MIRGSTLLVARTDRAPARSHIGVSASTFALDRKSEDRAVHISLIWVFTHMNSKFKFYLVTTLDLIDIARNSNSNPLQQPIGSLSCSAGPQHGLKRRFAAALGMA